MLSKFWVAFWLLKGLQNPKQPQGQALQNDYEDPWLTICFCPFSRFSSVRKYTLLHSFRFENCRGAAIIQNWHQLVSSLNLMRYAVSHSFQNIEDNKNFERNWRPEKLLKCDRCFSKSGRSPHCLASKRASATTFCSPNLNSSPYLLFQSASS